MICIYKYWKTITIIFILTCNVNVWDRYQEEIRPSFNKICLKVFSKLWYVYISSDWSGPEIGWLKIRFIASQIHIVYVSLATWLRDFMRMGSHLPFKCVETRHLHSIEFNVKSKISFYEKNTDKKWQIFNSTG